MTQISTFGRFGGLLVLRRIAVFKDIASTLGRCDVLSTSCVRDVWDKRKCILLFVFIFAKHVLKIQLLYYLVWIFLTQGILLRTD